MSFQFFLPFPLLLLGFPYSSLGKESVCNAEDLGSILGLGRFPWRRKWQPTPAFLPGESHEQTSLAGQSMGLQSQRWLATKPPPLLLLFPLYICCTFCPIVLRYSIFHSFFFFSLFSLGSFYWILQAHWFLSVYWWTQQRNSSFLLVFFDYSISFWFLLRISIYLIILPPCS